MKQMQTTDISVRERLVIGTAGLAGLWGPVDERASVRTLLEALDSGIGHIDTAPAYAHAEELVGKALKEWSGTRPFISTKVGKKRSDSPDIAILDYAPDAIRRSVEASLRLLGIDVIDMLFLHDPVGMQEAEFGPAIAEMHALRERGLVRDLGIGGNYGPSFGQHALEGGFTHFMGFNRYNLIRGDAAVEEYPKLRSAGLRIWQASPLYMGLLGNKFGEYTRDRPEWIPAADIEAARSVHAELQAAGLDMTGVALNYVFHSPHVDRVVLGASRPVELQASLRMLEDARYRDEAVRRLGA
jgi:aryl-alcohol dehydrogenase-like predicted oxidoreductase